MDPAEGFSQRSWTSLLEIKVSKFTIILSLKHLNFTNTDTQQTCVSRQIMKMDTGIRVRRPAAQRYFQLLNTLVCPSAVAVAISSKTVDFSLSTYTLCSSYHTRTHIWSSQWQHVWNGGAFRAGVVSLCSRNTEGEVKRKREKHGAKREKQWHSECAHTHTHTRRMWYDDICSAPVVVCDWLMAHNDGLSKSDRLELPLRASSVEPLSHAAHTLPFPHGSSPSFVASRRLVAGIKTLHSYWSLFLFSSSISRLSSASGSTPPSPHCQ